MFLAAQYALILFALAAISYEIALSHLVLGLAIAVLGALAVAKVIWLSLFVRPKLK